MRVPSKEKLKIDLFRAITDQDTKMVSENEKKLYILLRQEPCVAEMIGKLRELPEEAEQRREYKLGKWQ